MRQRFLRRAWNGDMLAKLKYRYTKKIDVDLDVAAIARGNFSPFLASFPSFAQAYLMRRCFEANSTAGEYFIVCEKNI
jgi:hypothetical protein